MKQPKLSVVSDIYLEHPDGTVTLKNNEEGQLVLDIPSKKLFKEMASYPVGGKNLSSVKAWHKALQEKGVELLVNVEDKHILRLGQEDSPYINYLYLAGSFISGLTGK